MRRVLLYAGSPDCTPPEKRRGLQSLFVFNRCKLTADPGVTHVWLGRPWRSLAIVLFLHTERLVGRIVLRGYGVSRCASSRLDC